MDFRRVFLTYLEAPNSILAKNKKNDRILLNLPIFPLSPCLGSLGLLSFVTFLYRGLQSGALAWRPCEASVSAGIGLGCWRLFIDTLVLIHGPAGRSGGEWAGGVLPF